MKPEPRVVGMPQLVWGAVKLAFFGLILATPLAGAWVSSSLAAYSNGSPRACLLVALLLFPILPLVWEGIASARSKARRTTRFVDRLILRTLFLNVLFLGVLLWRFPARAYVATSTRGDWFLDGRSGPGVDQLRALLFEAARGLKWINEAAQPNPYKKRAEDETPVVPKPTPVPERRPESDKTEKPTPITPTALWPQPDELHHAVREIPASEETSIDSVALYLRAHSDGPTDRIKALHDWVADRIAYDVPALTAPGGIPDEDAEAEPVFKNRKGVCAGYARLLRALAAVTGDQVEYVGGHSRNGEPPAPYGDGHAWNAAMIDGHWLLIDATWDAGFVDDQGFHRKYKSDFLFTPPEVFGITHQPDDDAWQLRERPIDRGAFMRQPMMTPRFYRDGFSLVDPDRSQVTVKGAFDAHLERPAGQFVMADARPVGGGEPRRCEVTGEAGVAVHCALSPGEYQVYLFDSKTRYGEYESMGSFAVNVGP